jgi:hypothetical protein
MADGSRKPIPGTFVTEGTQPAGSMWAMLPIPENGLGPRCLPGPNDTSTTPYGCQPWEGRHDGHNGHVPVSGAFLSVERGVFHRAPGSVLTGIHLCHACSCQAVEDMGTPWQGPCVRCPETPGSDCSRCDNGGNDAHSPSFPPPFPGVTGAPLEGVLDGALPAAPTTPSPSCRRSD